LYCNDINSQKRKDCITVLNIILECLLKWFAPIFVFTTEEIFSLVNKSKTSIHETLFPVIPQNWVNDTLKKKWENLYQIKQEVNIAIEEKRTNKEIGSSLEADILIYVSEKEFNLLEGLDLEEYFITSKAKKIKDNDNKLKIVVKKAIGTKCSRCWKILENKCLRCEEAMGK
jgi:isoleucyl-tRNA synthetase